MSRLRSKRILLVLIILLLLSLSSYFALTRNQKQNFVASVSGEGITKEEFEEELAATRNFFVWANQDVESLTSLEKDVLEKMISEKIVLQYAQKEGLEVSREEVEARYKAALGERSEEEYLEQLRVMYGIDKEAHLEKLKIEILKENIQEREGKPFTEWLESERERVSVEVYTY